MVRSTSNRGRNRQHGQEPFLSFIQILSLLFQDTFSQHLSLENHCHRHHFHVRLPKLKRFTKSLTNSQGEHFRRRLSPISHHQPCIHDRFHNATNSTQSLLTHSSSYSPEASLGFLSQVSWDLLVIGVFCKLSKIPQYQSTCVSSSCFFSKTLVESSKVGLG